MPVKSKIAVTADQPLFLGEYEGVGQRKVDLPHVHELAQNFHLWKDKPLLIWKDKKGTSFVIGGQHRMKAVREFILPEKKLMSLDMDTIVYSALDIPAGVSERDFILLLITTDNAGKENSNYDIAQLDHRKLWYSIPKERGLEFGQGGNAKTLHTEAIIRATVIARSAIAKGTFTNKPWINTYMTDTDVKSIERAVLYACWWDDHVAMPAHKAVGQVNMNKPNCLSLIIALALDPDNGFPDDPSSLSAYGKPKQRTLLEAPGKLLSSNLYDRTKGNSCGVVWTQLMEPINAAKKKDIPGSGTTGTGGRLHVKGLEKW